MKKIMLMLIMAVAILSANAQTRTDVKTPDLLSAITNTIAKDYVGSTITHATKVETNGVTTFEVVITKGKEASILVFDKDGKFLRKEAAKAEPVKKTTTPAKPASTDKK
jgi:hypothetical protein